ncbi:hypothetical protein KPH14_004020 [Odynerus spinipes]|uniref:GTP cyclohydrolase 1 feedback regulatory protein n=1 Tax=Odynerus spinipes TaxID=1348599 RepID=A0AAD9RXT4_9HYME|nr:hypothetical protein KPH14_004020 [Odynerus spinipes]
MQRSESEKQMEKTAKSDCHIDTMTEPANTIPEKWANVAASESYYYVGVKASPYATESAVFGLSSDETMALTKRFESTVSPVVNGVMIKGPPFSVINALAELGYRVISNTGETEILWTLQREV